MKITLPLQIFDSHFESPIEDYYTKNLDWLETIVPSMMRHRHLKDKHDAKVLVMARFKSYGTRSSNSLISYSALVLDIDTGFTINKFIETFSKYEFVLHTSYSHKIDDHRYRVIIPFKDEVSRAEFIEAKGEFKRMFPFADGSSFHVSQPFFFPSCHPDNANIAVAKHNRGELFDFKDIKDDIALTRVARMVKDLERLRKAKRFKKNNNSGYPPDTPERAIYYLDKTSNNLHYDLWIEVGMCLKTVFGDEGYSIWHEWSEKSPKFDNKNDHMGKRWISFDYNGVMDNLSSIVNKSKNFPKVV